MDSHSPWPDLCRDMLEDEIAKRLDSDIDRLCLRAVCRSWWSLLPPPCRPSLRLPFPMRDSIPRGLKRGGGYFKLVHSTFYCLQPLTHPSLMTTNCWLIRIDETEERGKVRLKDPLSRPAYSHNLSPGLPKGLNLLDYRVSEVSKVYDLLFVGKRKRKKDDPEPYSFLPAARVAVCSEGPVFAVIAIPILGPMSIWRKGDEKWTCLGNSPYGESYTDVVCHKGKFYALDVTGTTVSVDLSSLEIAIVTPPTAGPPSDNKRLLSDLGDLFLLHSHIHPAAFISYSNLRTYFHVYKLNEDKRTWVRETSLGDRAMIVCEDCIFCVSPQQCVGCKENCIYYNQRFVLQRGNMLVRDVALFDMRDSSAKMLSRVFGYSGLFWPRPSWIVTCRDDEQAEDVRACRLLWQGASVFV